MNDKEIAEMRRFLEKQFLMQGVVMAIYNTSFPRRRQDDNKELCNLLFVLRCLDVI